MLLRRVKQHVNHHLKPEPQAPLFVARTEQQRHLLAVFVAEIARVGGDEAQPRDLADLVVDPREQVGDRRRGLGLERIAPVAARV